MLHHEQKSTSDRSHRGREGYVGRLRARSFCAPSACGTSSYHPDGGCRRTQSRYRGGTGVVPANRSALTAEVLGLAGGGTRKGRAPPWQETSDLCSENQSGYPSDSEHNSSERDALEHAQHGEGTRAVGGQHSSNLETTQP